MRIDDGTNGQDRDSYTDEQDRESYEVSTDIPEDLPEDLPPCVQSMQCYCAGHARGNPADAPCDTREIVAFYARCRSCGMTYEQLDRRPDICGACGSSAIEVQS